MGSPREMVPIAHLENLGITSFIMLRLLGLLGEGTAREVFQRSDKLDGIHRGLKTQQGIRLGLTRLLHRGLIEVCGTQPNTGRSGVGQKQKVYRLTPTGRYVVEQFVRILNLEPRPNLPAPT